MSSLCQVCTKEPSKYRCPSCGTSSCSLTCSKAHKTQCSAPQPNVVDLRHDEHNGPQPEAENESLRATQATLFADFPNLKSSSELQALFTKHPKLRSQLLKLYTATLEPDAHEHNQNGFERRGQSYRGRGRGHSRGTGVGKTPWSPEKGFNRGLRALTEGLDSGTVGNPALEEFAAFVLKSCPVQGREMTAPDNGTGNP